MAKALLPGFPCDFHSRKSCGQTGRRRRRDEVHPRYFKISSVSGLSRKLLQALNSTGQFEMATICGMSACMIM
jgi:hypothetical protein